MAGVTTRAECILVSVALAPVQFAAYARLLGAAISFFVGTMALLRLSAL